MKGKILTLLALFLVVANHLHADNRKAKINGTVVDEQGDAIAYAQVYIENSSIGSLTDNNGHFSLAIAQGSYKLGVSHLSYHNHEQTIELKPAQNIKLNIKLKASHLEAEEVVIKGDGSSARLNKTAYNVKSLSLLDIKNSSANMTDALSKIGGVKIREAGGVGSESNISLNGFSGEHVKIFIDGVALDKNNSSFSLSNMPANFAERIDVYSGVVPIEFGTDAIGGIINIVTNKDLRYNSINIDASYSYGSFNTHSTYLNFGQVFKSGITYNINLYQNYSDNNYWIYNTVATFTENPGWAPVPNYSDQTIYRVQRFNDAYHNETAIGTFGVTNKSWADVLTLKFNYSQYDKEIQTGVVQDIVYGEKERTGHSFTPTLDYSKKDLLVERLDVRLSANYTNGYTRNYDPATSTYSWSGESVLNSSLSPTDNETKSDAYNASLIFKYSLAKNHDFTLSNTFGSTSRITRSMESGTTLYSEWETPKVSIKNIVGGSYRYYISELFDATAFVKYYLQSNEGVALNDDSEYVLTTKRDESLGYGAAATYFVFDGLQTKLSYEKAYRLPTSTEIFGDNDLEEGTFTLNPETSHNYNLNLTYSVDVGNHNFYVDGGLVYRDTRDYIIRSVSSSNSFISSASYENHGKVETKGYTISARYSYGNRFSVGGTFNNLSARNNESSLHGGTSYETLTYGLRLPNLPYIYANGDGKVNFFNLFASGDTFSVGYDLFYQHEFPLNWETIGFADTKSIVPTQLSHNVMINYNFMQGRYNLSLEAKNITDANLYDNYSLQKAGRAFYAKIRVNINKKRY